MSLIVDRRGLHFDGPQPMTWMRAGTDDLIECLFCGSCGGRLAHCRRGIATAALKAGTLDETQWLRPAAAIWLDEAQVWSPRCDGMLQFARGPEDYAQIVAAYRGGTAECPS